MCHVITSMLQTGLNYNHTKKVGNTFSPARRATAALTGQLAESLHP
jgi:hypothetical protein